MRTVLPELAKTLRTTDRTLRRAASQGLIRGERTSQRTFDMPVSERAYLLANWSSLARMREALRVEPAVRAALLFGSYARGDQRAASDVDILVQLAPQASRRDVAARLRDRLGLQVELIDLADAEKSPLLLAEVIREGRVLVDREGLWPRLRAQSDAIERTAARERRRISREFYEAARSEQ